MQRLMGCRFRLWIFVCGVGLPLRSTPKGPLQRSPQSANISKPIPQATTYTLTCIDHQGAAQTKQATVRILPSSNSERRLPRDIQRVVQGIAVSDQPGSQTAIIRWLAAFAVTIEACPYA